MRKRDEWIKRIRAVEDDYELVRTALEHLTAKIRIDPGLLPNRFRPRQVALAAATAEATYFIRLFAVFETGLRQAWRHALGRDTQPLMRDLMNGVAATCDIPASLLSVTHQVRDFRNSLVHDQDVGSVDTFTIGQARGHLNRFFSRLPPDW